jgi:hypothetical protein
MSGFFVFSTPGAPTNIDTTYERIGFQSNGFGTSVAASSSIGTAGSWVHLAAEGAGGNTSAALAGFSIQVQAGTASGARYLLDVATGDSASEVAIIQQIYFVPGTIGTVPTTTPIIPLNIPANSRISVRFRSSAVSGNAAVSIIGEKRTANHPPLYNTCDLLTTSNTASSWPNINIVAPVATPNTGWTNVVNSLGSNYGALMLSFSQTNTAPTNVQSFSVRTAIGGSNTTDGTFVSAILGATLTGTPLVRPLHQIIYKSANSGLRVASEVLLANTVDPGFHVQYFGFR